MTEDASALWIGGGLALAGTALGLVGSLVSGWLERRNLRHRLLRERYEEFSEVLARTLPWFSQLAACRSFDEIRGCPPPPEAKRLHVLSLIYFPEFKEASADYNNSLIAHFHLAIDCSDHHLLGVATIGAVMAKLAKDGEIKPIDLTIKRQNLDDLVERYAKKYTKA